MTNSIGLPTTAPPLPQTKRKVTKKYVRVGIGHANEHSFRAKLRGNSGDPATLIPDGKLKDPINATSKLPQTFLPSESWVETHFTEIDDVDADGAGIKIRYYQRGIKTSH